MRCCPKCWITPADFWQVKPQPQGLLYVFSRSTGTIGKDLTGKALLLAPAETCVERSKKVSGLFSESQESCERAARQTSRKGALSAYRRCLQKSKCFLPPRTAYGTISTENTRRSVCERAKKPCLCPRGSRRSGALCGRGNIGRKCGFFCHRQGAACCGFAMRVFWIFEKAKRFLNAFSPADHGGTKMRAKSVFLFRHHTF